MFSSGCLIDVLVENNAKIFEHAALSQLKTYFMSQRAQSKDFFDHQLRIQRIYSDSSDTLDFPFLKPSNPAREHGYLSDIIIERTGCMSISVGSRPAGEPLPNLLVVIKRKRPSKKK
jgi:hypothetical protein